jgi:hypothetical protein
MNQGNTIAQQKKFQGNDSIMCSSNTLQLLQQALQMLEEDEFDYGFGIPNVAACRLDHTNGYNPIFSIPVVVLLAHLHLTLHTSNGMPLTVLYLPAPLV